MLYDLPTGPGHHSLSDIMNGTHERRTEYPGSKHSDRGITALIWKQVPLLWTCPRTAPETKTAVPDFETRRSELLRRNDFRQLASCFPLAAPVARGSIVVH